MTNRPGVVGAVLQTSLSSDDLPTESLPEWLEIETLTEYYPLLVHPKSIMYSFLVYHSF